MVGIGVFCWKLPQKIRKCVKILAQRKLVSHTINGQFSKHKISSISSGKWTQKIVVQPCYTIYTDREKEFIGRPLSYPQQRLPCPFASHLFLFTLLVFERVSPFRWKKNVRMGEISLSLLLSLSIFSFTLLRGYSFACPFIFVTAFIVDKNVFASFFSFVCARSNET